jgi:Tfp pilus assembly protein PilN
MKAVNLIPADARRGRGGPSTPSSTRLPTYLLLGALAAALALVTVYVLANNSISERQARVTTLQAEIAQTQARSSGLSHFAQFSQMTQSRIASVRQLAATRFDWHATMTQISQVVPANTTLQTLNGAAASTGTGTAGTAAPTSTSAGAASGTSVEITGCTKTHDDVARLMSRLRLVDGVAGVTLSSSQKQTSGAGSAATGSASGGASSTSCGSNAPSFDMKIAFSPQSATQASGAASTTTSRTATATGATSSTSPTSNAGPPSTSRGAS